MGLKKRLAHTGCSHAVIGISGGLDSTLALLVTVRAFDMLEHTETSDSCCDHAVLWNHGPDVSECLYHDEEGGGDAD